MHRQLRSYSWNGAVSYCGANPSEEALARHGRPAIFNTDQGSPFSGAAFTGLFHHHGIQISMVGKGCWRDNAFVERLWRWLKYEEVYLHGYESMASATAGIARYFTLYNARRPHYSLTDRTPDDAYFFPLPRRQRPDPRPPSC